MMDPSHPTTDIVLSPIYALQDRIPPPAYRHAGPSAPWPWLDIQDDVPIQLNPEAPPVPEDCDHKNCDGKCWKGYPQSRFPNWTSYQVKKCGIHDAIVKYDRSKKCIIHKLDVERSGIFCDAGKLIMLDGDAELDGEWNRLRNDHQTSNVRVRILFVENMTGPVLRMLGGKYNIEPFFFSSSLKWIPSHFQEDLRPGVGDHITITLPFLQLRNEEDVPPGYEQKTMLSGLSGRGNFLSQTIDAQQPLKLKSTKKALALDLLSVHLVRNTVENTMISFHANIKLPTTRADYLHKRIRFAGRGVYWQKILVQAEDPTFLLLIFIWQAMYAWDEALRHLYIHICTLETDVVQISSMDFTDGLHVIRAHLLRYSSLLALFKKTVNFIANTPNPALTDTQRRISDQLLCRECATLLEEIERLDRECAMQDRCLKNLVDLVDSKTANKMTEIAIRDSAAMKLISYLSVLFLPATFMAAIFGVKVQARTPSTLQHYFVATGALMVITIWVVVAFQSRNLLKDTSVCERIGWPIYLIYREGKKVVERYKERSSPSEV